MLKKFAVMAFMAGGIAAAYAFGQSPGTPPDPQTMIQNRVNFLASQLGLTDAQKTSAITIFTNAYTAGQSIQSSLETNRQSMAGAIKKNDTATIDALAAESGTLSGQLTAINAKADAAFYAILTADQQAKYDSLPHGPGGRGGPGGPGPMGRFRGAPIR